MKEAILILEWAVLIAVAGGLAAGCAAAAYYATAMSVLLYFGDGSYAETLFTQFVTSLTVIIPLMVAIAIFLTIIVKSPLGRKE